MKTHFQRVLLAGAFCVFAGTAFSQGGNNRNGGNRPHFAQTGNSQRETQIRAVLTNAGFTDAATQAPIIALARMEQNASLGLVPKINALRAALNGNAGNNNDNNNGNGNNADGNNTDDNNIADLFADYRSAVSDIQDARETAINNLDKSVSFSNNPTLEALLTMLGIIGDQTGFVSSLSGQAQLPGGSGAGGMNGGDMGGMNGGGMNGGDMGGMNGGPGGMNGGGMAPPPPPEDN